jgi:hypothetical protein
MKYLHAQHLWSQHEKGAHEDSWVSTWSADCRGGSDDDVRGFQKFLRHKPLDAGITRFGSKRHTCVPELLASTVAPPLQRNWKSGRSVQHKTWSDMPGHSLPWPQGWPRKEELTYTGVALKPLSSWKFGKSKHNHVNNLSVEKKRGNLREMSFGEPNPWRTITLSGCTDLVHHKCRVDGTEYAKSIELSNRASAHLLYKCEHYPTRLFRYSFEVPPPQRQAVDPSAPHPKSSTKYCCCTQRCRGRIELHGLRCKSGYLMISGSTNELQYLLHHKSPNWH